MSSTLKQLLKEYENKRNLALLKAEEKKQNIYLNNPKLQEIDNNLSKLSIEKSKLLLSSKDNNKINIIDSEISKLKKQKNTILNSIGADFSPKFECIKCNDTGYVAKNNYTEMCTCLKQNLFDVEFNKYNVYDMQNITFEKFDLNNYSNKIDTQKYNSDISPRENIKLIKNIALKFISNFDDPKEKNLLFTGNSGLGKTFLSNCIANELLKKQKTVLYQTAPVMLDNIITYKLGKNNSDFDIYNHLLNVDLLIIDDLGTENINNMKFAELFTILNSRLLEKKDKITKTIISTNLDLKNLSLLYGERIISRFVGSYNICYFYGDDIRFKK